MKKLDRNKTLQDWEAEQWGEPDFHSSVVTNVHRLRRVPLKDFSVEDVRLMVAQQQSLAYLIPVAIEHLANDPLSEGDSYPGDLLCAVLRVPDRFWQQEPSWRQQVRMIIDQAIDWLDTLQEWERQTIEDDLLKGLEKFATRKR